MPLDVTEQVRRVGRAQRRRRWGDRHWLFAAVLASVVVYVAYLFTHPYPAYGAGLYLEIAQQIQARGYRLPAQIPHYTAGGVPYAYPPLLFAVAAVVRDLTGVGPFAYARFVPGLVTVAYLFPFYYLAKALLGERTTAGVATLLLAGTPAALQWHLSAGGIVRAPAFLIALTGCYTGCRLFQTGDWRWLAPSAVLFGLQVLAHPTYSVFFAVSYLLFFAAFDRSLRGLVAGALVAASGVVVATPWLWHLHTTHGIDTYLSAAGTHGGIGGGLHRLAKMFVYPLDLSGEGAFFAAAFAGGVYALARRQWVLPAWLLVAGYAVGKHRFLFVPGSMLTAALLCNLVLPAVRRRLDRPGSVSVARLAGGVVVLAVVLTGALYAGGVVDLHYGSTSQPSFVDADDEAAMAWAERSTAPDSEFVVLGDAAEWFPLLTDRTMLVGPWGVEWQGHERYRTQLSAYKTLSTCDSASCITTHLSSGGYRPDYVYVPSGHYTVRGFDHAQTGALTASMRAAPAYEVAYRNDGVVVFEVVATDFGSHSTGTPSVSGG